MLKALRDASEWYYWDAIWIIERAKAFIEVEKAPYIEIEKIREDAEIVNTEVFFLRTKKDELERAQATGQES